MNTPKDRLTGLDGLRGIAAIGVMCSHYTGMHIKQHVAMDFSIPLLTDYGHYGVQLFFILSGFVIWITLQRKSSPRAFALARFHRLYPTFWFCMLLTTIILLAGGKEFGTITPALLMGNATMLPKQFLGIDGYLDGSYWTLEYELYFYVIAGAAFYVLGRQFLIRVFVLLSLLGVAWCLLKGQVTDRSLGGIGAGVLWRASGWFLLEHAHLFLIGLSFAEYRTNRRKAVLVAMSLGMACAFAGGAVHGMIILILTAIVAFATTAYGARLLNAPALLFLGAISYPLYLLHQEIGYVIITSMSRQGWAVGLSTGFASIVAITIAALVTYGFEQNWRDLITSKIFASVQRLRRAE